MKKISKKELKSYIALELAKDINCLSVEECRALNAKCDLEKVAYCTGTYGISGGLLKDKKTGNMYAITARNTNLLYFF